MPADTPESRIAAVVAAIPAGRVSAYGWVADLAGLPGRARMVARVLVRWEGAPLPWQRVLRSDGRIAFAPGSTAFARQARLLGEEGVAVHKGRVDLARFGWRGDLDAMLWHQADL
jgi:methylated-DNA-protein-cysteine methyltransferase related protein